MGEYIEYKGQSIKLGTCESLFYTRLEQLERLEVELIKESGNLSASEYLDPSNGFRYRFPFPDEDKIEIGQFEDYNKGLTIRLPPEFYGLAELEHREKWVSCSVNGAYNVNIATPCPQSAEFTKVKHSPIDWRLVDIVAQKQVNGEVWTVIRCPYCEAMSRLDADEAHKLTAAIRKGYVRDDDTATSKYYQEVIDRIERGYKTAVTA